MGTIAVVGGGAWGTALASHAARLDHSVTIWAHEPEVVEEINTRHTNGAFLPHTMLPMSVRASNNPQEAVSRAELVVLVPPAQHVRRVATLIAPFVPTNAVVVVASKGIEESRLALMSEVIEEVMPLLGRERLAFLSGPSFAREVAQGLPTDVSVASYKKLASLKVQQLLHSPLFRVYSSDDVIGVQIGGAVKNVIAIAAGACDGLHFGHNARAALVTRGLAEITRLGVSLGADPLTFLGMAGAGDLFLTCSGNLSRNRTLGLKIAEGIDPQIYLAERKSVAEGFYTAAAAHELAQKRGVDMPIVEQVFHVLHRSRPLLEAIRLLLTRAFKDETLGLRPQ
jgi:glycerol-3-phosphate dehydrogenase (NAD(P)+)